MANAPTLASVLNFGYQWPAGAIARVGAMWSRLFGRRRRRLDFSPAAPDQTIEIVRDIHGRADLLRGLPAKAEDAVRVYVGDYIDRGPESRAVLEHLHSECSREGVVCLMGNHEAMLLQFLDTPGAARHWLRYGGLQTLASFGARGLTETAGEAALYDAAQAVLEGLSFDLVAWLKSLPVIWSSGTLSVAHAGLDPMAPLNAQEREIAIWGHPEFGSVARDDGQWVAHGHTIVDAPRIKDGVISVDTGAYATGRLTIARVTRDGDISFQVAGTG